MSPSVLKIILPLALTLLLGACAVQPPSDQPISEAADEPLAAQARSALANGDRITALARFETLAAETPLPESGRWMMRAALLYLQFNRPAEARRLLDTALPDADEPTRQLARLVEAGLIVEDDPEGARDLLTPVPDGYADWIDAYWHLTLAEAEFRTGDPLNAARRLVARDALLSFEAERETNRQRIRRALAAVPMAQLRTLVPATPDRFGAWVELAFAVREQRLSPPAMSAAVREWLVRYPDHPANPDAARDWLDDAIETLAPPRSITLMLPLSGRLGAVGEAVRDGFLSAWYAAPAENRPDLRIVDVGEQGVDSLSAYRQAVDDGVDLVIGPLTKPALLRMAVWDTYPVPVLALNRLQREVSTTSGLYQFGLAPEEDARAAALMARALGHRNVTLLTPGNDWGRRIEAAFRETFLESGGRVPESQFYDADAADHGGAIQALFNLDDSRVRAARLRSLIRRDIEFTPRRRQDMDAVFIAAYPQQARLLKPQIRFHHGIGLPVLATSHAYSGIPAPEADRDMNGMRLVVTPWILPARLPADLATLRASMRERWPETTRRFGTLYALGADAYRLAGPVDVLSNEGELQIEGLTGRLSVSPDGIIHRDLLPARIEDGELTATETVNGYLGEKPARAEESAR